MKRQAVFFNKVFDQQRDVVSAVGQYGKIYCDNSQPEKQGFSERIKIMAYAFIDGNYNLEEISLE